MGPAAGAAGTAGTAVGAAAGTAGAGAGAAAGMGACADALEVVAMPDPAGTVAMSTHGSWLPVGTQCPCPPMALSWTKFCWSEPIGGGPCGGHAAGIAGGMLAFAAAVAAAAGNAAAGADAGTGRWLGTAGTVV